MKNIRPLLLALPLMFALGACSKSEPNAKDSLSDALDQRPHEKTRDAAEDTGDAMKKAAGDTKDAVKDAAETTKDAVKDATK